MPNRSDGAGWAKVVGALVGVGLIAGLLLGVLGSMIGLPSGVVTIGVGVICGLAAPLLISRMRAQRVRGNDS